MKLSLILAMVGTIAASRHQDINDLAELQLGLDFEPMSLAESRRRSREGNRRRAE